MQAIMETLFDIFYLTSVITLGILMASRKQAQKQYRLFGIMAILLGFGDAFHLIPRAFALWTTGLENHAFSLGMGKLITSITMTIFYVILYHVWRMRYHITEKKGLTAVIYVLAFLRIILCLCPQNAWTSPAAPFLGAFTETSLSPSWGFSLSSCFIKAPVSTMTVPSKTCG